MKIKRNKIINLSILIFIIVIIVCSYFSETIKNMLLPEVTVASLKSSTIGNSVDSSGTVYYENTHKIFLMSDWSIKDICVKVNQNVKKGDVLAKVYNNEIVLKEREEQQIIMQLQDEINDLKKASTPDQNKIQEDQYKLNTENLKYKEIRKGLTSDGSILSDVDGKIYSINSQYSTNASDSSSDTSSISNESSSSSSGESSSSSGSNALFEIVNSNSKLCVEWVVSSEDSQNFSIGNEVNITYEDSQDETSSKTAKATISDKKYDSSKDEYELSASIITNNSLKANDTVTVSTESKNIKYNNVIPKSCLYEDNGIDYIYEVNSKNSALSSDQYVKKVQVQVIDSDSLNCSIKSSNGIELGNSYGIVSSTSKPIEDNSEVRISTTDSSR